MELVHQILLKHLVFALSMVLTDIEEVLQAQRNLRNTLLQ
jgi:hypothetical protein